MVSTFPLQPQYVTVRGHDYEFEDGVYKCLHHDFHIERDEDFDGYPTDIAVCNNTDPACGETILDPAGVDWAAMLDRSDEDYRQWRDNHAMAK